MNKVELLAKIAENETVKTKKAAGEMLDIVVEAITDALAKGDEVKIFGFGTFSVAERAERQGRNPQTSETITIPAFKVPKFKAAKALKDIVNV